MSSTEPRERMRDSLQQVQERARAMDAGRYVHPHDKEDDRGQQLLTTLACAVVLIVVGALALWASGVLS